MARLINLSNDIFLYMASHRAYLKFSIDSKDLPINPSYVMPDWIDADVPELCTEMLIAWGRVCNGDPDSPEEESQEHIEYRNILRDAHRDYQVLFQAQENTREDGTFLSSIASAMANMPSANELVITDGEDVENYFLIDRDYRTSMRVVLLAPQTWAELSSLTRPDFEPPIEFLHRIPTEIHKTGTPLQAMRIQCTGPWSYAKLSMSPSEKTSLIESIQDLKTLTFEAYGKERGTHWQFRLQGEVHIVHDFLSCLVQTSGLERLTIALSKYTPTKSSKILIRAHPKCMKQLCLSGFTVGAGDLGQYLVHVQGPCDVVLEDADLRDGQWAEEVDVLRGLLRVSITCSGLRNAEFADLEFRKKWNLGGGEGAQQTRHSDSVT
ncbi:hypothetical protein ACHAP8_009295 [Fusarium lateritium]